MLNLQSTNQRKSKTYPCRGIDAMTRLKIIGKKGSKSRKDITDGTGIKLYRGNKRYPVDAIINYGLAGSQLQGFYRMYPSATRIPTVNRTIGFSKLNVINRAEKIDIQVPESKLSLSRGDSVDDFIEKKFNSISGIGIQKARGKRQLPNKYYQRFISDRRYELRIHAFKWYDQWPVQKRLGPEDQIAWNFKQGGHFVTVHNPDRYGVFKRAKEVSGKILDMLGMSFGAVDFIVDKRQGLWFLEVNSAPGLADLSRPIYIDAFNTLQNLSLRKVLTYATK